MPRLAHDRIRVVLRIAVWLALGAWIGAFLLCGGIVVPAAFAQLAEPGTAAALVGQVLGPLQLAAIFAGIGLAALGGALGRGRLAVVLPLALAACCAANHFVVSPALAAIDLADPAAGPGVGVRFARLHQLSLILFMAAPAGAVVLALVHLARELREERHGEA